MSVNNERGDRQGVATVRQRLVPQLFSLISAWPVAICLAVVSSAGAETLDDGPAKQPKTVTSGTIAPEAPRSTDIARTLSSAWTALSGPPPQCLAMQEFVRGEGLRSIHCALRGVLGLAELEALAGQPFFLYGPHDPQGLRLMADAFGAYSPAMVQWIETNMLPAASDTEVIARTQWIYDQSLGRMARAYHRSYVQLSRNLWHFDQERRYLMAMIEGDRPWAYMGARFQPDMLYAVLDLDIQAEDLNWYHVDTAIRYWQRRSIDGTADEVFQALETLLSVYDPDYLASAPRPAGNAPHLPPPGAHIPRPAHSTKPSLPEPR